MAKAKPVPMLLSPKWSGENFQRSVPNEKGQIGTLQFNKFRPLDLYPCELEALAREIELGIIVTAEEFIELAKDLPIRVDPQDSKPLRYDLKVKREKKLKRLARLHG